MTIDAAPLQRRLNALGYPVAIDGQYGPATQDAALLALPLPAEAAAEVAHGPSDACAALIKQFEGCAKKQPDGSLLAYPDPGSGGDPWTIGWGSTGPDIKRGTVWTQAQADARFAEHLASFSAGVSKSIGDAATTQHQFDAMVSLAYNIGLADFSSSTLLRMHRAGDYAGAAAQFARWNKAAGKVLAGLTRRRAAEALLYGGGA